MIVIMQSGATAAQIEHVIGRIGQLGLTPHVSRGQFRTIIGAIGDKQPAHQAILEALEGVERVVPIMKPFKLASREFHAENTVVHVKGVDIGGGVPAIIAGPCAIENRDMLERIARAVKERGAAMLRGGAFKPRTSPYEFQGLGEEALKMMREVGDELDMPIVSEVLAAADVEMVGRYVDMFQIGARNVHNFQLLKEVGDTGKPVLLKRGFAATIREYLMSAEYVLSRRQSHVRAGAGAGGHRRRGGRNHRRGARPARRCDVRRAPGAAARHVRRTGRADPQSPCGPGNRGTRL